MHLTAAASAAAAARALGGPHTIVAGRGRGPRAGGGSHPAG